MPRPTSFQMYIRPLIRELDREQMLLQRPGLDLWDPESVKNNAGIILSVLENTQPGSIMPPMAYGGPWPGEWVSLFRRWVSESFPSLELGTATHYEALRSGERVGVTATISKPNQTYAVWLDRYFGPALAAGLPDLVLYQEQRDIPPPPVTEEGVGIFRFATIVTSLRILDRAGLQMVPIVSAAPDALHRRFRANPRTAKVPGPAAPPTSQS
jgi:hypothetical protein